MLDKNIHSVMVIGSGPIVIGQAAEFDYAGSQACKALKEQGLRVSLVNSNPATLMTDHPMADAIYIEPLILETVKRIIEKEKPDGILSSLGGQTGLTLCMELSKSGFLESHGVRLLGAKPETIDKAEDRRLFKETMQSIGEPCIPSKVVTSVEDAVDFARNVIGCPAIVRPAFTLGGTGGGIARDEDELAEIARNGLRRSPIHQALIEKCVSGWKEIEFEVMRDGAGNAITVCSMENLDPVGVHTGDSIVAAPALTLSDKEYQMLRSAALNIISSLGMEGGCNVQFALNPESFEYAVIEVNPRVSRSSALASKATGYPIAKVATLIAIGYTLDEIPNAVTKKTSACFEPALDYVVVKMPKFPFDKFVYAARALGTQMKATGEVMAIGRNFESALMKAARGAEIGVSSLDLLAFAREGDGDIRRRVGECTDQRIFAVFQALKRGAMTVDEINSVTKIDRWFLEKINNIARMESMLEGLRGKTSVVPEEIYKDAKSLGFLDKTIEDLSGAKAARRARPAYKMVDTCAGEFDAETPYFYAVSSGCDEAAPFIEERRRASGKGTVIVLGSGPIRIGQGIEFDYASVQCARSLKKLGYDVVTINNNPETVSTDFDTSDRLYFEPLTPEDVMDIIEVEKPVGVVVAFGGQTAIKLTKFLDGKGIPILGTSADSIDIAEDRERFEALCDTLKINKPKGETVLTLEEALESSERVGYPVLLRPSYVLGGQNMIIAFNGDDVTEYMRIILSHGIETPVLIDKYMMGVELEVDAICDGRDILIPGIMEHIERTGIHSGDSIAVYPSWNLNDIMREKIIDQSRRLSLALGAKGLVNIQYLICDNDLFIIEVNPRSSRTVPYISKVTGVPMVDLAVRAMMGESLRDMGFGTGLYRIPPYFAVKVPVFSFEKLMDVDTHLGPEMKSTGEVLGLASTMEEAIFKGCVAAGYNMKRSGGVLFSVRETDRYEIPDLARKFYDMGFKLYATEGNARTIRDFGMEAQTVNKIHENPSDNLLTLLDSGQIDYVISTSAKGRDPRADSVKMRRHAVERDIPCFTAIDTANAIANCLRSKYSAENVELVDINNLRESKQKIKFTKMSSTGNDFIVIDAFGQEIGNPAGLAARLCDRRSGGIGADSLVMIERSAVADAKMRFFNLDGSEGKMAGNAIRCVGKYLYDNNVEGIAERRGAKTDSSEEISIETGSGVKRLTLYKQNGKVTSVTVDMGAPAFAPESLPASLPVSPVQSALSDPRLPREAVIGARLRVSGADYSATCVGMGNPHCVVFSKFVDKEPLEKIGALFETHEAFPERTNTEFVRVVGSNELKVRCWERGNGETLACGTGACAAAVAAALNGFCPIGEDITVKMRGGALVVRYTGATVLLTGNTKALFDGEVEI